jgi:hypothetical protein
MFRAGQRSARRQVRIWQSVAGLLVAGLAGLALWNGAGNRPSSSPAPMLVSAERVDAHALRLEDESDVVHAPAPTGEPTWASGAGEYVRLRTRVTLDGVDALPTPRVVSTPRETVESIADWLRVSRQPKPAATVPGLDGPDSLRKALKFSKGNLS